MIYLLCGVPGSGKSWVASRIENKVSYIPHDHHSHEKLCELASHALIRYPKVPVLVDCPFAERALRSKLERVAPVTPVFIVEAPSVVRRRYLEREGILPEPNIITRARTIMNKVNEWSAFYGTSDEVLDYFKHTLHT